MKIKPITIYDIAGKLNCRRIIPIDTSMALIYDPATKNIEYGVIGGKDATGVIDDQDKFWLCTINPDDKEEILGSFRSYAKISPEHFTKDDEELIRQAHFSYKEPNKIRKLLRI